MPYGKLNTEFRELFSSFYEEYVMSEAGKLHAERYNRSVETGRANFREVLAARERGEDLVSLVDHFFPEERCCGV